MCRILNAPCALASPSWSRCCSRPRTRQACCVTTASHRHRRTRIWTGQYLEIFLFHCDFESLCTAQIHPINTHQNLSGGGAARDMSAGSTDGLPRRDTTYDPYEAPEGFFRTWILHGVVSSADPMVKREAMEMRTSRSSRVDVRVRVLPLLQQLLGFLQQCLCSVPMSASHPTQLFPLNKKRISYPL